MTAGVDWAKFHTIQTRRTIDNEAESNWHSFNVYIYWMWSYYCTGIIDLSFFIYKTRKLTINHWEQLHSLSKIFFTYIRIIQSATIVSAATMKTVAKK